MRWVDSVTVVYQAEKANGQHIGLVDVRTGPLPGGLDLPDSIALAVIPVPGGWAWIPANRDRVIVERAGKRQEIALPRWYSDIYDLSLDPTGTRLMLLGWNSGSNDSLGVAVAPLDGDKATMWAATYAEAGGAYFLADGSVLLLARPTQETMSLLQATGPGSVRSIGLISRPNGFVSVSRDLKRALVVERTYHGDAWMSRIVRP